MLSFYDKDLTFIGSPPLQFFLLMFMTEFHLKKSNSQYFINVQDWVEQWVHAFLIFLQ
jgi:hypothetical protein